MTDEPTRNGQGIMIEEVDEPLEDVADEFLEDDEDSSDDDLQPDEDATGDEQRQFDDLAAASSAAVQHIETVAAQSLATAPPGSAEPETKFRSAISRLKAARAQRQARTVRPVQARVAAVPSAGAAVSAPNHVQNLHVALSALADAETDAQVARVLWDWITHRSNQLTATGFKGLATRWSIVLHALGAEVAFGRNEWRPR